jgi:hypothetical protein
VIYEIVGSAWEAAIVGARRPRLKYFLGNKTHVAAEGLLSDLKMCLVGARWRKALRRKFSPDVVERY